MSYVKLQVLPSLTCFTVTVSKRLLNFGVISEEIFVFTDNVDVYFLPEVGCKKVQIVTVLM